MKSRRQEILEEQKIKNLLDNIKSFESPKCNCELCKYLRTLGFFKND
jgi:hypothetical protein